MRSSASAAEAATVPASADYRATRAVGGHGRWSLIVEGPPQGASSTSSLRHRFPEDLELEADIQNAAARQHGRFAAASRLQARHRGRAGRAEAHERRAAWLKVCHALVLRLPSTTH